MPSDLELFLTRNWVHWLFRSIALDLLLQKRKAIMRTPVPYFLIYFMEHEGCAIRGILLMGIFHPGTSLCVLPVYQYIYASGISDSKKLKATKLLKLMIRRENWLTEYFIYPLLRVITSPILHLIANHELIDVLVDCIPAERFKHSSLHISPSGLTNTITVTIRTGAN